MRSGVAIIILGGGQLAHVKLATGYPLQCDEQLLREHCTVCRVQAMSGSASLSRAPPLSFVGSHLTTVKFVEVCINMKTSVPSGRTIRPQQLFKRPALWAHRGVGVQYCHTLWGTWLHRANVGL